MKFDSRHYLTPSGPCAIILPISLSWQNIGCDHVHKPKWQETRKRTSVTHAHASNASMQSMHNNANANTLTQTHVDIMQTHWTHERIMQTRNSPCLLACLQLVLNIAFRPSMMVSTSWTEKMISPPFGTLCIRILPSILVWMSETPTSGRDLAHPSRAFRRCKSWSACCIPAWLPLSFHLPCRAGDILTVFNIPMTAALTGDRAWTRPSCRPQSTRAFCRTRVAPAIPFLCHLWMSHINAERKPISKSE